MLICPELQESPETNPQTEEDDDVVALNMGDEGDISISIHALLGSSGLQTMQVVGMVKKQKITMLVDSGSTHNFVYLTLAKRLGLKLTPIQSMKVSVADGSKLPVQFVI